MVHQTTLPSHHHQTTSHIHLTTPYHNTTVRLISRTTATSTLSPHHTTCQITPHYITTTTHHHPLHNHHTTAQPPHHTPHRVGLIESRLRRLVSKLESNYSITLAHIHTKAYTPKHEEWVLPAFACSFWLKFWLAVFACCRWVFHCFFSYLKKLLFLVFSASY